jgi:hypothetical protein
MCKILRIASSNRPAYYLIKSSTYALSMWTLACLNQGITVAASPGRSKERTMARFPKKLVLVAALAELLILAMAGRSEVFSPKPQPTGVNFMSTMSALPNAAVAPKHVKMPAALSPKKAIVDNEVITIVFEKEPSKVI